MIEAWDGGIDRRIVGLHLLAQGFERFLKLTLVLVEYCSNGSVPTVAVMKTYGHHLTDLLDNVVKVASLDNGFAEWPAVREDLVFLGSDARFRRMLNILGDFGARGRYHDLDLLVGAAVVVESPLDRWNELESDIHNSDPDMIGLMHSDQGSWSRVWHPALARQQVATLQRGARGIARIWTLGPARCEGIRLSGIIGRFLFLADVDLGSIPPSKSN